MRFHEGIERVVAIALVTMSWGTGLACGPLLAMPQEADFLQPGDHEFSIEHDGRTRSYLVHMPPAAGSGDPLPVVVNFHGGGGNVAGHKENLKMDAAADDEIHTATPWIFGDCRDDAEVILWKLTGSGHVWPGSTQGFAVWRLGPSTEVIDANTLMWELFSLPATGRAAVDRAGKARCPTDTTIIFCLSLNDCSWIPAKWVVRKKAVATWSCAASSGEYSRQGGLADSSFTVPSAPAASTPRTS